MLLPAMERRVRLKTTAAKLTMTTAASGDMNDEE